MLGTVICLTFAWVPSDVGHSLGSPRTTAWPVWAQSSPLQQTARPTDVVVLMESIAGEHAEAMRLVDEYTLVDGVYVRTRENVEFLRYLHDAGFHVIRVTDRMHANYGCNFINCGKSHLIAPMTPNTALGATSLGGLGDGDTDGSFKLTHLVCLCND